MDEIFGEHLQSEIDDEEEGIKVDKAVKLADFDKNALKKAIKRQKNLSERENETQLEKRIRLLKDFQKKFLYDKQMKRAECQALYDNIMLLVTLRIMQGPLFIHALLATIKLSKEILAISLEQGREVVIPKRLGQKHLALSF